MNAIPFRTPAEQLGVDMEARLAAISRQMDRIALQRDCALAALAIEQERRMELERELDWLEARGER